MTSKVLLTFKKTPKWLRKHWIILTGLLVVLAWCIPYFTTGDRIEWGDFSFFAQNYEAIRISILQYHQFPWWNPWMVGGEPLYANPQIGVFSIQTPLVLLFGAPVGLKLSVILYEIAGYFSMYVLFRKYFKIKNIFAVLLSLAWILSTFFVAHLPSHYTFVWYLLAPLFVYLSLTVKNWKGGILLGAAFAIMALSAVHNPFFQIGLVCGVILIARLFIVKGDALKRLVIGYGAAIAVLLVLSGQRLYLAYQMVSSFDRGAPSDPALNPLFAPMAVLVDYNRKGYTTGTVGYPNAPFSWGEATSSAGLLLSVLFFGCVAALIVMFINKKLREQHKKTIILLTVLVVIGFVFFVTGIGKFIPLTPYNVIKHLPVFGQMRVSTRWFLWVTMLMLIVVGVTATKILKAKYHKFAVIALFLVVVELFSTNFGYQADVLSHVPIIASQPADSYTFDQVDEFGSKYTFSDGRNIPNDGTGPLFYREYEATTFNLGVVRANEPLVNNRYDGARCVSDKGCGMILSNNATIASWSPDKLVIHPTSDGPIVLNINPSDYVKIDGKRLDTKRTADVKNNLTLNENSGNKDIVVEYTPHYL